MTSTISDQLLDSIYVCSYIAIRSYGCVLLERWTIQGTGVLMHHAKSITIPPYISTFSLELSIR